MASASDAGFISMSIQLVILCMLTSRLVICDACEIAATNFKYIPYDTDE